MLPSTPPSEIAYTMHQGDDGWPVYALQSGLNQVKSAVTGGWDALTRDGAFGPATFDAVVLFQKAYGLYADGIPGPKTQAKIISVLDTECHRRLPSLPAGLMKGWIEGEGANVLAAVNWSVAGGVDCGTMQYRVYGPPYSFTDLLAAFSPLDSMMRGAQAFLDRADYFIGQPGVKGRSDRVEFSKRLAVLAHNWPAGAQDIANDGTLSNPNGTASWVPAGVKFPDGEVVNTRWEWCQYYAMGRGSFSGMIPKYVDAWS